MDEAPDDGWVVDRREKGDAATRCPEGSFDLVGDRLVGAYLPNVGERLNKHKAGYELLGLGAVGQKC